MRPNDHTKANPQEHVMATTSAKSVKRFERSNGLDTALYKNYLYLFFYSSHQGVEATLRRARDSIYWHGMTNDIKEMIGHCAACANERPSQQKETLRSHDIPSMPWAKVGMDLFAHANETYLIIVDYYSDFFEFTNLVDQKSETTIKACKEQFTRYGCPLIVQSDGGPQFISAEFEQYSHRHGNFNIPCRPHTINNRMGNLKQQ